MINYYETGGGRSYHEVSYYYDDLGNLEYRVEKIGDETRVTTYTYDKQNRVTQSSTDDYDSNDYFTRNASAQYYYDDLDRVTSKQSKSRNDTVLISNTIYRPNSNQVAQVQNYSQDDDLNSIYSTTYTYDDNGNIKTVNDGSYTTTYTYDGANQLIREDNQRAGKTWAWIYDDAGNLVRSETYDYTTGTLGATFSTISNVYGDSQWGDLLTEHGSAAFTYDEIGNTLTDGTWTYTWERGRQLKSMTNGTTTWNMTYDADGMRTSRIAGSNKYYYYYHDGLLTYMKYNSLVMRFTYDAQGRPVSMTYNGNLYFYALNQQGDVMALLDVDGNEVVSYHYDAWGKLLNTTASTTGMLYSLALYNPLRYRGYVYDRETGLYYVSSRYYNPEICRFISADNVELLGANGDVLSYNLYAYCGNNPVIRADQNGHFWHIVIGAAVGAVIGAVSSIVAQTVSGREINWAEVGVSAASGAVSGAINAAIPGMGAVATGLTQGAVGAATYAATELVNGRKPTIAGTLAAGITSGVLAGGVKVIGNKLTTTKLYRSVSSAEANSFSSTGKLSAGAGQMEGKFFATSRADAKMWGARMGSSNIISIRVPNSALSHSSVTYFSRLDAIGPAYYFSDLAFLNSVLR